MTNIRAQVILHTTSAVPADYVSNSWAFTLASTAGAGALLTPILKTFYDSIRSYISPTIAASGHEIKYSLLPGTPPNYPFDTDLWAFGSGPAGTAQPEELALALSFQGNRVAGFPQSRRRGRIYMGPLNQAAFTADRPAAAFMTAAANAAIALKTSVAAIGGGSSWIIWSQVDQAAVDVDNGWIDNAPDVQRRRGLAYTSRTLWA
jgi:hypothetical protein